MEHVAIPLTDTLLDHMRARVARDGFRDAGEYLRSLVSLDLDRAERLRTAIQEGLDSGISKRSVDEIFEDAMRRHLEAGSQ
ncbi:ribbon-helix-helix domain-containing protein [Sphingomonas profundi]|uniref:ribbon-helix-helix domain-containing protein n=1 Tax=Alterirhizorhabdus profundi TaxID=2681549 RepID=UPI0018D178E6|nr:type II toxin-antitoxin system ParD family antitoxin [Sphingomonas profundi]